MTRRTFLHRGGLLVGAAALAARARAQATDRPDVLFIAIEDVAPRMGCYGHPVVKTPHIDSLARRGVVFERAYCMVPVCNPSRAAVASGLRPETTGVFGNSVDWRIRMPDGHSTLYECFRDAGYETAVCGKLLHHERYFKDKTPEAQQRENRFWTTRLGAPAKGARKPATRPKAPMPKWLKKGDYNERSLNWGPTGLADIEQRDGATATAVAKKLAAKRDGPLFMAVGLHAPHYPLRAPDRYFAMYPPDRIELPQVPDNDLADVPYRYGTFNTTDELWCSPDETRQEIAAYYATISYIDTCVGILLDALREAGRERNTVVCLWGDHGMHLGEHGLWRKYTLFENACRVPLVIAAPGVAKEGAACRRPVELIDMYPTLADLCDLPEPKGLEAVSMKPLLADPERPWKQCAFTSRGKGQRSLRTERHRYTEWGGPDKAELYDHQTDPGEHTNLAKDPEHAATVAELSKVLRAGWKAALPEGTG